MRKINEIFLSRNEFVKSKRLLSVNDFKRKVWLVHTNKNKYVVKTGREIKREIQTLKLFTQYFTFKFFPKIIGIDSDFLILQYLKGKSLNQFLSQRHRINIRTVLLNMAKIINFLMFNPKLTLLYKNKRKLPRKFLSPKVYKNIKLISPDYLEKKYKNKLDIKIVRFIKIFAGICDIDFGLEDVFISKNKVFLLDFEYFYYGNTLFTILELILPLLNYLSPRKFMREVEIFINNLKIRKYGKKILSRSLIKNFELIKYIYNSTREPKQSKYNNISFITFIFSPEKLLSQPIFWSPCNKFFKLNIYNLILKIKIHLKNNNYVIKAIFYNQQSMDIIFKRQGCGKLIILRLAKEGKYYIKSKSFNISYIGNQNDNDLLFIEKISEYIVGLDRKNNFNIFKKFHGATNKK